MNTFTYVRPYISCYKCGTNGYIKYSMFENDVEYICKESCSECDGKGHIYTEQECECENQDD